jgi:hypothetical protein
MTNADQPAYVEKVLTGIPGFDFIANGGLPKGRTALVAGSAGSKMRGSTHEKDIRELVIDNHGMHIGAPFRNVAGILAGNPVQIGAAEMERLDRLFPTDNGL